MASTVSPSHPTMETHSVFDMPEPVFAGYPPAIPFPALPNNKGGNKFRTFAFVATAVAILSLLVNAIMATVLVVTSQQSTAIPVVEPVSAPASISTPADDVDQACVSVLRNGGKPQDCARMYLMEEFPGYPR